MGVFFTCLRAGSADIKLDMDFDVLSNYVNSSNLSDGTNTREYSVSMRKFCEKQTPVGLSISEKIMEVDGKSTSDAKNSKKVQEDSLPTFLVNNGLPVAFVDREDSRHKRSSLLQTKSKGKTSEDSELYAAVARMHRQHSVLKEKSFSIGQGVEIELEMNIDDAKSKQLADTSFTPVSLSVSGAISAKETTYSGCLGLQNHAQKVAVRSKNAGNTNSSSANSQEESSCSKAKLSVKCASFLLQ